MVKFRLLFFYSQNLKQDILNAKQAFIDWKADREKKAVEKKVVKKTPPKNKRPSFERQLKPSLLPKNERLLD